MQVTRARTPCAADVADALPGNHLIARPETPYDLRQV
jgi:hypothetical protein